MTLQDLKDQLKLHGTNNFRAYYCIGILKIYEHVGSVGRTNGAKKQLFPPTDLSPDERNALFWDTIGSHERQKYRPRDKGLDKCKEIVQSYVEPVAEPYEGRFKEFFNRF